MRPRMSRGWGGIFLSVLLAGVVLVCTALPLAWLGWEMLGRLFSGGLCGLGLLLPADAYEWKLHGLTLLYGLMCVGMGLVLAAGPAVVIGRGSAAMSGWMTLMAAVSCAMPLLAQGYGWQQWLLMLGMNPEANTWADVLRCTSVLALGGWGLIALPAGWALRAVSIEVDEAAKLDGARWRVLGGCVSGPVGVGCLMLLWVSSWEFAAYEPTGIAVTSTEMRLTYESGLRFGQDVLGAGEGLRERAGLAATVAVPLVLMLVAVTAGAGGLLRRAAWPDFSGDGFRYKSSTRLSGAAAWMWMVIPAVSVLGPPVGMILSAADEGWIGRAGDVASVFGPQMAGTLLVAGCVMAVCMGAGLGACAIGRRWTLGLLWLCGAAFATGGLLWAVAVSAVWAMGDFEMIRDYPAAVVMGHVGRWAWVVLLAGAWTYTLTWKWLRQQAAVDGADAMQTARYVIWPLAWPTVLACAGLCGAMAMGDIPLNLLLAPLQPPTLTPMLMTWAHIVRYEPMLMACLLLQLLVLTGGAVGAGLWVSLRKGGG